MIPLDYYEQIHEMQREIFITETVCGKGEPQVPASGSSPCEIKSSLHFDCRFYKIYLFRIFVTVTIAGV